MTRLLVGVVTAGASMVVILGNEASAEDGGVRAGKILERSVQTVRESAAFHFEAQLEQRQDPREDDVSDQTTERCAVVAERPNKIAVWRHISKQWQLLTLSDGNTIVHPRRAPKREKMFRKRIFNFGHEWALQICRLFLSISAWKSFRDNVQDIRLAEHRERVRGIECYRLTFLYKGVKWTIWVRAGKRMYPVKAKSATAELSDFLNVDDGGNSPITISAFVNGRPEKIVLRKRSYIVHFKKWRFFEGLKKEFFRMPARFRVEGRDKHPFSRLPNQARQKNSSDK